MSCNPPILKSIALCAQVLDEEYLDYYYKRRLRGGQSLHDLQLECMAEPELSPFQSRSIDMRVLTGQTSLFYKARAPGLNWQQHQLRGYPDLPDSEIHSGPALLQDRPRPALERLP